MYCTKYAEVIKGIPTGNVICIDSDPASPTFGEKVECTECTDCPTAPVIVHDVEMVCNEYTDVYDAYCYVITDGVKAEPVIVPTETPCDQNPPEATSNRVCINGVINIVTYLIAEGEEPVELSSIPTEELCAEVDADIIIDCKGGTETVKVDQRVSIVGAENIIPVRVVEDCEPTVTVEVDYKCDTAQGIQIRCENTYTDGVLTSTVETPTTIPCDDKSIDFEKVRICDLVTKTIHLQICSFDQDGVKTLVEDVDTGEPCALDSVAVDYELICNTDTNVYDLHTFTTVNGVAGLPVITPTTTPCDEPKPDFEKIRLCDSGTGTYHVQICSIAEDGTKTILEDIDTGQSCDGSTPQLIRECIGGFINIVSYVLDEAGGRTLVEAVPTLEVCDLGEPIVETDIEYICNTDTNVYDQHLIVTTDGVAAAPIITPTTTPCDEEKPDFETVEYCDLGTGTIHSITYQILDGVQTVFSDIDTGSVCLVDDVEIDNEFVCNEDTNVYDMHTITTVNGVAGPIVITPTTTSCDDQTPTPLVVRECRDDVINIVCYSVAEDGTKTEVLAKPTDEYCEKCKGEPKVYKGKKYRFAFENSKTRFTNSYKVEFTLNNGTIRVVDLPTATNWGTQMDDVTGWGKVLTDAFPELCEVTRHWADWKQSQLPQSGAGSIPQTDMLGLNEVDTLVGQYIQFEACPDQLDYLPVGARFLERNGSPWETTAIYLLKEGATEYKTFCISCDEDCAEIVDKCFIPAEDSFPVTPEPQCTFNTFQVCEWAPDMADPNDPNVIIPGSVVTQNIFLRFAYCGAESESEAFTLDADGNETEFIPVAPNYLAPCDSGSPIMPDVDCPSDCNWTRNDGVIHAAALDNNNWTGAGNNWGLIRPQWDATMEIELADSTTFVLTQTASSNAYDQLAQWEAAFLAQGHYCKVGLYCDNWRGCAKSPNPNAPSGLDWPVEVAFGNYLYVESCDATKLPVKATILKASGPSGAANAVGAVNDNTGAKTIPFLYYECVSCDGNYYKDCDGNLIDKPCCACVGVLPAKDLSQDILDKLCEIAELLTVKPGCDEVCESAPFCVRGFDYQDLDTWEKGSMEWETPTGVSVDQPISQDDGGKASWYANLIANVNSNAGWTMSVVTDVNSTDQGPKPVFQFVGPCDSELVIVRNGGDTLTLTVDADGVMTGTFEDGGNNIASETFVNCGGK